ncbi:atypical/ABC1/ABC1-B protein kinase [Sistotremastrum niveocremeum HHB9708]|uniref:Atypical/ABC1/ABC1-B protein kinase n=1 Tax=Sistotremastrum niveocremeum HHB9708 TaxID=1314777 RepID=A0A164MYS6_9AGAM|nr:atypical/ABC1/ABC1-B protein kinase [Sistotremastrum niveocremeum HHB9708]
MFTIPKRSPRVRIALKTSHNSHLINNAPRYSTSSSLSKPKRSLLRKTGRAIGYIGLGIGVTYTIDKYFNATAIGRNVRTLFTGAIIAADYKLNFQPEKSDKIPELQERVAERLYNLITENGGLYIKIGQMIGANTALLPPAFQTRFGKLFDDAPQIPYHQVENVFLKEFGKMPQEVFDIFIEEAVASASLAQVHKARLKNGDWVAVKIQKPAVTKQVEWDLAGYKALMWIYDYLFPLPVYFLADFISSHLRDELDFAKEASNALKTKALIESTPSLASRVYVPKVYLEYTTPKIMTAEWIDGVRLSDKKMVKKLVEGGPVPEGTKENWDGAGEVGRKWRDKGKGVKGGNKAIMQTMVDIFSAQIFMWGFIHCDPHPGNFIIRRTPSNKPQLVLLDHGLYITLDPKFREEYALLWKSLLTLDYGTVADITRGWGIGTPDLFASATLMKPVRWDPKSKKNGSNGNGNGNGGEERQLTQYEIAEKMREKLKGFLIDTDKMPKALAFLGRNMRIVQGNNASFGSPVNRIRITASWASRSLASHPSENQALSQRLVAYYRHIVYLSIMLSMDIAFYTSKVWGYFTRGEEGWEEQIERGMRGFAKQNFGVEIAEGAFNA